MVEGARLEGVCARESTGGSNPPLSVQLTKTVIATWRFAYSKRVRTGDSNRGANPPLSVLTVNAVLND